MHYRYINIFPFIRFLKICVMDPTENIFNVRMDVYSASMCVMAKTIALGEKMKKTV